MATLFEKLASNLLDLGLRNRSLNFKDQKLRLLTKGMRGTFVYCEDKALSEYLKKMINWR